MKHHFLFLAAFTLAAIISAPASAQSHRVLSPDGLTYLDVKLSDGRLSYSAGYRTIQKAKKKGAKADTLDVPVLLDSPLGVYTNVADFSKDLTIIQDSQSDEPIRQTYQLRQGKQSSITTENNDYNLLVSTPAAAKSGVQMSVHTFLL